MQLQIKGRNVEVNDAIRSYAETKLMKLERQLPRDTLVEVQLQQSDEKADHHWSFTPEHNAAGRIDAGRVLDTLVASGAQDVMLILEVIPGWEDADERVISELQSSVELWRNAMAERGIHA